MCNKKYLIKPKYFNKILCIFILTGSQYIIENAASSDYHFIPKQIGNKTLKQKLITNNNANKHSNNYIKPPQSLDKYMKEIDDMVESQSSKSNNSKQNNFKPEIIGKIDEDMKEFDSLEGSESSKSNKDLNNTKKLNNSIPSNKLRNNLMNNNNSQVNNIKNNLLKNNPQHNNMKHNNIPNTNTINQNQINNNIINNNVQTNNNLNHEQRLKLALFNKIKQNLKDPKKHMVKFTKKKKESKQNKNTSIPNQNNSNIIQNNNTNIKQSNNSLQHNNINLEPQNNQLSNNITNSNLNIKPVQINTITINSSNNQVPNINPLPGNNINNRQNNINLRNNNINNHNNILKNNNTEGLIGGNPGMGKLAKPIVNNNKQKIKTKNPVLRAVGQQNTDNPVIVPNNTSNLLNTVRKIVDEKIGNKVNINEEERELHDNIATQIKSGSVINNLRAQEEEDSKSNSSKNESEDDNNVKRLQYYTLAAQYKIAKEEDKENVIKDLDDNEKQLVKTVADSIKPGVINACNKAIVYDSKERNQEDEGQYKTKINFVSLNRDNVPEKHRGLYAFETLTNKDNASDVKYISSVPAQTKNGLVNAQITGCANMNDIKGNHEIINNLSHQRERRRQVVAEPKKLDSYMEELENVEQYNPRQDNNIVPNNTDNNEPVNTDTNNNFQQSLGDPNRQIKKKTILNSGGTMLLSSTQKIKQENNRTGTNSERLIEQSNISNNERLVIQEKNSSPIIEIINTDIKPNNISVNSGNDADNSSINSDNNSERVLVQNNINNNERIIVQEANNNNNNIILRNNNERILNQENNGNQNNNHNNNHGQGGHGAGGPGGFGAGGPGGFGAGGPGGFGAGGPGGFGAGGPGAGGPGGFGAGGPGGFGAGGPGGFGAGGPGGFGAGGPGGFGAGGPGGFGAGGPGGFGAGGHGAGGPGGAGDPDGDGHNNGNNPGNNNERLLHQEAINERILEQESGNTERLLNQESGNNERLLAQNTGNIEGLTTQQGGIDERILNQQRNNTNNNERILNQNNTGLVDSKLRAQPKQILRAQDDNSQEEDNTVRYNNITVGDGTEPSKLTLNNKNVEANNITVAEDSKFKIGDKNEEANIGTIHLKENAELENKGTENTVNVNEVVYDDGKKFYIDNGNDANNKLDVKKYTPSNEKEKEQSQLRSKNNKDSEKLLNQEDSNVLRNNSERLLTQENNNILRSNNNVLRALNPNLTSTIHSDYRTVWAMQEVNGKLQLVNSQPFDATGVNQNTNAIIDVHITRDTFINSINQVKDKMTDPYYSAKCINGFDNTRMEGRIVQSARDLDIKNAAGEKYEFIICDDTLYLVKVTDDNKQLIEDAQNNNNGNVDKDTLNKILSSAKAATSSSNPDDSGTSSDESSSSTNTLKDINDKEINNLLNKSTLPEDLQILAKNASGGSGGNGDGSNSNLTSDQMRDILKQQLQDPASKTSTYFADLKNKQQSGKDLMGLVFDNNFMYLFHPVTASKKEYYVQGDLFGVNSDKWTNNSVLIGGDLLNKLVANSNLKLSLVGGTMFGTLKSLDNSYKTKEFLIGPKLSFLNKNIVFEALALFRHSNVAYSGDKTNAFASNGVSIGSKLGVNIPITDSFVAQPYVQALYSYIKANKPLKSMLDKYQLDSALGMNFGVKLPHDILLTLYGQYNFKTSLKDKNKTNLVHPDKKGTNELGVSLIKLINDSIEVSAKVGAEFGKDIDNNNKTNCNFKVQAKLAKLF